MTTSDEVHRTPRPVRELSADDLGIGAEEALREHASNRPDDPGLLDNDPKYQEVLGLLPFYGGVIFTGPPGTSKTWYAHKIGEILVDDDEERIRFVQFHPSYQYEDFMQGFAPREDTAGFVLRDRVFMKMCRDAELDPTNDYVLVIDELSRGDPGRIFGEALTYVEKSKRGLTFELASGETRVIPSNLIILATMNPNDRGVDEVDAAFERRFAKIAMEPSRAILDDLLERNGVGESLKRRILGFFNLANARAVTNPQGAIGHAYFLDVRDKQTLASLWDHQLRFVIEKAYRLDPATRADIEAGWSRVLASDEDGTESTAADDAEEATAANAIAARSGEPPET